MLEGLCCGKIHLSRKARSDTWCWQSTYDRVDKDATAQWQLVRARLILNIDREAEHSPDDFKWEDIYGKITLTSGDKRTKYLHTPRPELQEGQGDFRSSSKKGKEIVWD